MSAGKGPKCIHTHSHTRSHTWATNCTQVGPSLVTWLPVTASTKSTDRGLSPRPLTAGFRPKLLILSAPLLLYFPSTYAPTLPLCDLHSICPLSSGPRVPIRPHKAWTPSQPSLTFVLLMSSVNQGYKLGWQHFQRCVCFLEWKRALTLAPLLYPSRALTQFSPTPAFPPEEPP